jgi:hypothetical protein
VTQETAVARPGVGAVLRELDQALPSELVDVCSSWLARDSNPALTQNVYLHWGGPSDAAASTLDAALRPHTT